MVQFLILSVHEVMASSKITTLANLDLDSDMNYKNLAVFTVRSRFPDKKTLNMYDCFQDVILTFIHPLKAS